MYCTLLYYLNTWSIVLYPIALFMFLIYSNVSYCTVNVTDLLYFTLLYCLCPWSIVLYPTVPFMFLIYSIVSYCTVYVPDLLYCILLYCLCTWSIVLYPAETAAVIMSPCSSNLTLISLKYPYFFNPFQQIVVCLLNLSAEYYLACYLLAK